jgi:hypothetical protein
MKRLAANVLAPLLAAAIGVTGYFCLARWADCRDWDRACLIYGPNWE